MPKTKARKEEWNLKLIFRSDDDHSILKKREVLNKESYKFINKWKDRNDYLESPKVLKQALCDYEHWMNFYGTDGDEGYYFSLRESQNQNDPKIKARLNQIKDFANKIHNDIQFFELRIAKIGKEKQKKFLRHKDLKEYKHFLEKLFSESQYLLSEPEEKIINLKSDTSYSNWVKMTSSFISKEQRIVFSGKRKKEKTFAEIQSLLSNKSKKVRDSAAAAFNDIIKKNSDVAEAEINSILENKKTDDMLRNIPRPDATRHISDDIESRVVDTLIKAVSSKFRVPREYYKLKARLFKVERLAYHERHVPYGDMDREYSYQKAISLVSKVFYKLDREFGEILDSFVKQGRVDVFPRKGKSAGAFCTTSLLSQPTYILLNFTNQLEDVLTIAHELGHGINDELMRKKQNSLNFRTPLSTAEVASTFMEDFVIQEILKRADDDLRLSIQVMKLDQDIATIFRQAACYMFEQEMHSEFRNKGYLSKEDIGKIFQKHMSAYMGGYVEQSPGSENWWVSWMHIRSFFYNYSYVSGLLISKSLQRFVREDHDFIEKVKQFLAAGSSDSPTNIFKDLGINIRSKKFWDKGISEIEELLKDTERLARKLGKV